MMKIKKIILAIVIIEIIISVVGINTYAVNIINTNVANDSQTSNNSMKNETATNKTDKNNEINTEENTNKIESNNNIENVNKTQNSNTVEKNNIVEENKELEKDTNIVNEEIQETSDYSLKDYSSIKKTEKLQSNGIYKIAVGADSNKTIEVAGSDISNGAKVDIWNYGNATAQKFYFEYQEGYYKITAMHTGKSLTAKGNSIKEGTEIVQSDYTGLDGQKWLLRDSGKNGWVISPLSNPNLAISVKGSIVNGAKIVLSATKDNDNQMYYLYNMNKEEKTQGNGIYKIALGVSSNKTMEVAGSSKENNAKVDIWDYGNATAQKFYFEYQEGYYKITAMHTGKSLTAKENSIKEGTEIVQRDYTGADGQKWLIKDSGKNGWLISPLSNPNLSISVQSIKNGSKLILSKTQNTDKQMYYLYNINSSEKTQSNGTYEILVGANPNKGIEVAGSDTSNGAKIGIWDYGNVDAQKFNIEYKEGFYKITAKHTGKSLTAKGDSIKEGTEIIQSDYKGIDGQKWLIKDSGKNGWLISPLSNPELTISIQGAIQNGSKLILSKNQINNNQMFYFIRTVDVKKTIENGIYEIAVGADSSKAIEVAGGSRENNAKLDIWTYGNSTAQKFKIEYIDGYYKILAGHTNKSLTVKKNNITNGIEIVQDEYRGELGQKWIIRDSKINGWTISPITRPDLAISIENTIKNGSKIILEGLKKDNDRQMYYLYKTNIGVNIDSNKYPGIESAINKLVEAHPNWEFEILYTGLDFNTVVKGEYEYANKQANLVYTPTYKGDWIAPNPYVSGQWASASYKGIAYFMDPRNFLNDDDVFQFVDLGNYASSGATRDSIQYQVNGTFLNNYAEDLRRLCENNNINPYYIIARLFQEQGRNGSSTLEMDGGDGKKYYNPFNIGAVVGNDVATALARAKKEGWDTMVKGLEGGMKIVKSGYIDVKQHTLYLNKFDVNPASGGGFYNHQYMQNLSAAHSEADILRSCYVDTNTLDNRIKFVIPVYENMPKTISERPTGQGGDNIPSSDKGPISVKVADTDMGLALRKEPSTSGALIERMPTGSVLCSIERLSNGWHKVIAPSGNIGYCSNINLQVIANETNCKDRVRVKTNDGTGTNVRTGPGTSYNAIRSVGDGTKGTRIMTNKYNYEGYSWDIVIFDDGTKGFVATNYLVKIN